MDQLINYSSALFIPALQPRVCPRPETLHLTTLKTLPSRTSECPPTHLCSSHFRSVNGPACLILGCPALNWDDQFHSFLQDTLQRLQMDRKAVSYKRMLGEGAFGEVREPHPHTLTHTHTHTHNHTITHTHTHTHTHTPYMDWWSCCAACEVSGVPYRCTWQRWLGYPGTGTRSWRLP